MASQVRISNPLILPISTVSHHIPFMFSTSSFHSLRFHRPLYPLVHWELLGKTSTLIKLNPTLHLSHWSQQEENHNHTKRYCLLRLQISKDTPAILLHFLSKFTLLFYSLWTSNTFRHQLTNSFYNSLRRIQNYAPLPPWNPPVLLTGARQGTFSLQQVTCLSSARPGPISFHLLEDFTTPLKLLFSRSLKTLLIPTSNVNYLCSCFCSTDPTNYSLLQKYLLCLASACPVVFFPPSWLFFL